MSKTLRLLESLQEYVCELSDGCAHDGDKRAANILSTVARQIQNIRYDAEHEIETLKENNE